jgi:hypothetical protein
MLSPVYARGTKEKLMRFTKTAIVAVSLAALSHCALAEKFEDMFMREGRSAIGSGSGVVVFFHTDKSLATVTATVSAAMKSSNPDAIINKNWVTEITFRGSDPNRKCGLVIGKWASGALRSNWEQLVYSKVKNSVNTITFQHVMGGTLKTLEGTPASEGDDLLELCMG